MCTRSCAQNHAAKCKHRVDHKVARLPDYCPEGHVPEKHSGVLSNDTNVESSSLFQGTDLGEQAFLFLETERLSLRKQSCPETQVDDREGRKG